MIKVKEYLDANLFSKEKSSAEKKSNGHYQVFGHWVYPEGWNGEKNKFEEWCSLPEKDRKEFVPSNHISITINNETIIVGNIFIDGKCGPYHYLQTYEHIPRGEPDQHGYYARSTDEEIIKYIDERLQKIKSKLNGAE